jgi:hypothetical protein
MMREFGKPDTTANIAGVRALQEETPVVMRLDEPIAPEPIEPEGVRPFHANMEDEKGNNTAKIIGGVVVGLLIIGGGIYAYESSRSLPTSQQVALQTPAVNQPALDRTAAAPPAPEAMTPGNNAAPAAAPAPKHKTSRAVRAARNADENSTVAPAPDAAINAPMTLTPDTAPPPEQALAAQPAPTGQSAMQQPVTAPGVTSPATPAPEIANNNAALPAPAISPQLPAPQLPAPADQPAQAPAQ